MNKRDGVLQLARALGLFALSRWYHRRDLRILCYHGIWLGPAPHYGDCLFMSAQRFERRMDMLAREGYNILTLVEGLRRLQAGGLGRRDVVITIDDAWAGTWLHMVPVLQRHGFPATLYVATQSVQSGEPVFDVLIGYLVDRGAQVVAGSTPPSRDEQVEPLLQQLSACRSSSERGVALRRIGQQLGQDVGPLLESRAFTLMTAEELRQAQRMGLDLQLHTHTHSMHGMDPQRVHEEIVRNRQALASILDCPPAQLRHFCYPSGENEAAVFATLRACRIDSATTTEFGFNPSTADPMCLRRVLDCQSMSDIEVEARLSGFWGLLAAFKARLRSMGPGPDRRPGN